MRAKEKTGEGLYPRPFSVSCLCVRDTVGKPRDLKSAVYDGRNGLAGNRLLPPVVTRSVSGKNAAKRPPTSMASAAVSLQMLHFL